MARIGDQEIREDSQQRLGFHPASDESRPLHAQVRRHFMWLDSWIQDNIPDGREKALALTNLQQASLWCNAGIACNLAPLVHDEGVLDPEPFKEGEGEFK